MPNVYVHYPAGDHAMKLAVGPHWNDWLDPLEVSEAGTCSRFDIPMRGRLTAQFKAIKVGARVEWAQGHNSRLVKGQVRHIVPFFSPQSHGQVRKHQVAGRTVRIYEPPGYSENHLLQVPVVYMQDGQSLFERGTFGDWMVDETLDTLHRWSHIRQFLVVGIDHGDRFRDYTEPGWRDYRDWILQSLLPYVESIYRLREGPRNTALMGSSLGGLVSMFLAWDRPDIFGKVACFSGAFPDFGDSFVDFIRDRPKPELQIYLDSGMAGVQSDGFDATRSVRDVLEAKGFVLGQDLVYCCFPDHQHNEAAWSSRFSLPLQFFFGG